MTQETPHCKGRDHCYISSKFIIVKPKEKCDRKSGGCNSWNGMGCLHNWSGIRSAVNTQCVVKVEDRGEYTVLSADLWNGHTVFCCSDESFDETMARLNGGHGE